MHNENQFKIGCNKRKQINAEKRRKRYNLAENTLNNLFVGFNSYFFFGNVILGVFLRKNIPAANGRN
jgi:hypothetical protein